MAGVAWGSPAAHGQWRARAGQARAQPAAPLRVGAILGRGLGRSGRECRARPRAVAARLRTGSAPRRCCGGAPRCARRGWGPGGPEAPLYAVQGAPSATIGVEPRAVRAGAQCRRSGGTGPRCHSGRPPWGRGRVHRHPRHHGAEHTGRQRERRAPASRRKAAQVVRRRMRAAEEAVRVARPPAAARLASLGAQGAVLCGAPAHRQAPPAHSCMLLSSPHSWRVVLSSSIHRAAAPLVLGRARPYRPCRDVPADGNTPRATPRRGHASAHPVA
jgi:hypothetical protein